MLLLAHRSQEKLAQSVVRFHVLANSDSEEDQALKLKVRDQVISYLETELKSAGSREETEAMLQRELTAIRRVAVADAAGSGKQPDRAGFAAGFGFSDQTLWVRLSAGRHLSGTAD